MDSVKEYQIKAKNEDFRVTEISDLDLSGGKYSIFLLYKSGLRTVEAIDKISLKTGIPVSEICYSGLKDEDAVTYQYISIKNAGFDKLNFSDDNGNYFFLEYIGNSPKRMEIGELYGNAFCIRIRKLDSDTVKRITDGEKKLINIINYYGVQRFGKPGLPKVTHLIGKAFFDGDFDKMAHLLLESGNITSDKYNIYINDHQKMIDSFDIRELNFFLNAWDSYVWNNKIADIISRNTENSELRTIAGISYIYSKYSYANLNDLSNISILRHRLKTLLVKEEYTSFRQPFLPLIYRCSDIMPDDMNDGKLMVDIKFTLPSGAYATIAVDQIIWQQYESK